MSSLVQHFKNISELSRLIDGKINTLKHNSEELSKTIGEKLRATETADPTELQALREKLEGPANDPKKKKSTTKKKDQKSNWHELNALSIYDGIGLKGELELYFRALEITKSDLDNLTKVKQTIDDLVNKGLKKELPCVFILNHELPAKMAFVNPKKARSQFTFKSILSVGMEDTYAI